MKTFIVFFIGIILGFILAQFIHPNAQIITQPELIRDTITFIKPSKPIIMEKIIPKIIYRKDTLIVTKSFTAKIDTVIKLDTILIEYKFPENRFSFAYKPKIDTASKIYNIIIPKYNNNCSNNWVFAVGGFAAGIILSNLSK